MTTWAWTRNNRQQLHLNMIHLQKQYEVITNERWNNLDQMDGRMEGQGFAAVKHAYNGYITPEIV